MPTGRRIAAALALALGLCVLAAAAGQAQPPAIGAKAAVLMDRLTGTVLFDKAMHERRPMASTTKIMTALVALESADTSEYVTILDDAIKVESPGLNFQPGERVLLNDLLAALLLKSSNAAAIAIADHVSGSVAAFAQRMNERARDLGAADTNFVNPHGLAAPGHYSSAYDLALITREAMKLPRFRELVAEKVAEIARPDAGLVETIQNHNKLLWRADYVDGVKTGYVRESGHCLVASGSRDNWQLIAVALDSPDTYGETLQLLEYGFASYQQKVLAREGDAVGRARVRWGREGSVPAICRDTLAQVVGPGLPPPGRLQVATEVVKAPVAHGEIVGAAQLVVDGKATASSPLLAAAGVPLSRLVVAGAWALRIGAVFLLAAVGVRTSAKLVKARRRRRSRLPPESGPADPGGASAGRRPDGDGSGPPGGPGDGAG